MRIHTLKVLAIGYELEKHEQCIYTLGTAERAAVWIFLLSVLKQG